MTYYHDIPRALTALAEWGSCLACCLILPRRVSRGRFALISALMGVVQCLYMVKTRSAPQLLWLPCMAGAIALMGLYLFLVLEVSRGTLWYELVGSFLFAELAASLAWALSFLFNPADMNADSPVSIALILGTYVFLFGILVWLDRGLCTAGTAPEMSGKDALVAGLIGVSAFLLSNAAFINIDPHMSWALVGSLYAIRLLCDLAGVVFLYAFRSRIQELRAEREVAEIRALLRQQYDNYRFYQENLEEFNLRYHDLKHQIIALRAQEDSGKRSEMIDQMTEDLEAYSPPFRTGSSVLDVLLASKQSRARNLQVKMTCVADGKLLEMLHVTDLCTIFGNALDNALEALATVEDPEKRIIHLSVSQKKRFVLVVLYNYCERQVKFQGDLPQTSKRDSAHHGYGTRSIRYTVEKYGGTATFSQKENLFELRILLPMEKGTAGPGKSRETSRTGDAEKEGESTDRALA